MRAEMEATGAESKAALEKLRAREKELARDSRRAVEEAVAEAREAIRAIVREAQAAGTARAAEAARGKLAATAAAVTSSLPEEPPPPGDAPPTLEMGALVFVPSLKSDGAVVKMPDAKGRVKVAVGAMTFDVAVAELRAPKKPPAKTPSVVRRPAPKSGSDLVSPGDSTEYAVQSKENTLDLRGMRADEAVEQVDQFLDRAALDGRTPIFVIHGFGTGALRTAVREYLARSPYVRKWRPGDKRQGGDGVSVIDL